MTPMRAGMGWGGSPCAPDHPRVVYPDRDIAEINEQVLRLLRDGQSSSEIARLLAANESVTRKVTLASPQSLQTAVGCGLPLVRFVPEITECLLSCPPAVERATPVPRALKELSVYVLTVARSLEREFAQILFALSPKAIDLLSELQFVQLARLVERSGVLLALRDGDQPKGWLDYLGTGSPMDLEIAQASALLAAILPRQ